LRDHLGGFHRAFVKMVSVGAADCLDGNSARAARYDGGRRHLVAFICGGFSVRNMLLSGLAGLHALAAPAVAERIALVHANVITMVGDETLHDATVLVEDGVILAVGEIEIDDVVIVVDATGKYLIPGLHDMHVHIASAAGPIDPEDQLAFMLTQGVTTARGLVGRPEHIALRDRVERGEIFGPTLLCAGPVLAGFEAGPTAPVITVKTPEEGAAAVQRIHDEGYDLVKVHEALTPEVYAAIAQAAADLGMPISGHVTPGLDVEIAIAAGQQIEHLDGYIRAAQAGPIESEEPIGQFPPQEALDNTDWDRMRDLAEATAESGVVNGPTMALFALLFDRSVSTNELRQRPEMRAIPAAMLEQWANQREDGLANGPDQAYVKQLWETRARVLRSLHSAGALLMTGSDSPQAFMVPGAGTHLEMQYFVKAGLSAREAMLASTRSPAAYLGRLETSGTIEPGKVADLVLLNADPLADIRATTDIAGVMTRGRWLDRTALDAMLDVIVANANPE